MHQGAEFNRREWPGSNGRPDCVMDILRYDRQSGTAVLPSSRRNRRTAWRNAPRDQIVERSHHRLVWRTGADHPHGIDPALK
jgi:hypothetical protein